MVLICDSCDAEFNIELVADGLEGSEILYCPFCGESMEDHQDDDDGDYSDDDC